MGTPSFLRIIKYFDLTLKALDIFDRRNGTAVEGLSDSNLHIQIVVGEGGEVSVG